MLLGGAVCPCVCVCEGWWNTALEPRSCSTDRALHGLFKRRSNLAQSFIISAALPHRAIMPLDPGERISLDSLLNSLAAGGQGSRVGGMGTGGRGAEGLVVGGAATAPSHAAGGVEVAAAAAAEQDELGGLLPLPALVAAGVCVCVRVAVGGVGGEGLAGTRRLGYVHTAGVHGAVCPHTHMLPPNIHHHHHQPPRSRLPPFSPPPPSLHPPHATTHLATTINRPRPPTPTHLSACWAPPPHAHRSGCWPQTEAPDQPASLAAHSWYTGGPLGGNYP